MCMKAEIITIGDEILIGQIVDSNSAWIAQQLNKFGISVYQITSVSDKKEHIVSALDSAFENSDVVIMTGGLGPTKDDITKITLVDYFKSELIFDENTYKHIAEIFETRGIHVGELNRKQAEVPACSQVLPNSNGTAPGMWFDHNGKVLISIPGVPYEMKALMIDYILPKLKDRYNLPEIFYKVVYVQGIPESHLAEKLEDWEIDLADNNIKLAYLPQPGIIRLRLSVESEDVDKANNLIDDKISDLYKIIPDNIYSVGNNKPEKVIGELLLNEKATLATAESCSGGNIAHLITLVSGSSQYFKGSVVAYSNEIKENVLNVSSGNINEYGAVSKLVVEEMALGVLKLYNSDYAVATSGIAGPDGGTEGKPVGTTWIAVASKDKVISEVFYLGENRGRNIQKASLTALNMLRLLILKK